MWRFRELLPVAGEPTVGLEVGGTPLLKADRLAKRLGIRELWIKNDAVNYPTLSFKDRVVSVALSRAKELGFETVACASTGNLANSVAANAASAGLKSYVFIPSDLEHGKIVNSLIYGSNVIGTIQPIAQFGRICREHDVTFAIDTAQTAGIAPINMKEMNVDVLAFTGHKALMGSMGIGGLCVRKHVEIRHTRAGGTGSRDRT